jgi:hypothetical protein
MIKPLEFRLSANEARHVDPIYIDTSYVVTTYKFVTAAAAGRLANLTTWPASVISQLR